MKAVLHVSELGRWSVAVANTKNLLAVHGDAQVVLVLNADAVTLFKTPDQELLTQLEELTELNASVHLCRNALAGHEVPENTLPDTVAVVPAGIVDLISLQEQGYFYIRP